MRCDLCGEVYLCIAALSVDVFNDTGWVSDGFDEASGNHSVQRSDWATKPISAQRSNVQQRR